MSALFIPEFIVDPLRVEEYLKWFQEFYNRVSRREVVVMLGGHFVQGYIPGSQTFTAGGTFIVSGGVTSITVEVYGGGGGGALGGGDPTYSLASGAGGGGYSKGTLTVAPYQSITVTIGVGGVGGNPGATGGTTTVSSLSAKRGTGGGGKKCGPPPRGDGGGG